MNFLYICCTMYRFSNWMVRDKIYHMLCELILLLNLNGLKDAR